MYARARRNFFACGKNYQRKARERELARYSMEIDERKKNEMWECLKTLAVLVADDNAEPWLETPDQSVWTPEGQG